MVAMHAILLVVLAAPEMERRGAEMQVGYGLETLAADAGAWALLVPAACLGNQRLAEAGLTLYSLGGPTLHLVHRRWWRAPTSLGIRVGPPATLFFLVTFLSASRHRDSSPNPNAIDLSGLPNETDLRIGAAAAGVAMLFAQVLDATLLARQPPNATAPATTPAECPTSSIATTAAWTLLPYVTHVAQRIAAGVLVVF
jgi:hypothetical protein